ncbi:MAG: NAD(P)H-quinone oxidoreductase [Bacteroidia bacterium]
MKAILAGKDEKLCWEQQPDPAVPKGYVMLDVKAAGVNRADLLQRKGLYPPPPGASEILGLELAGEIIEINGNTHWQQGQRAMALVPGGAYASKAVVPVGMLLPIPSQFSYAEAAAIPEAILTSYLNLVTIGKLKAGETVLIHAGAGGIGSTAIQLATALKAKVITTAGTDEKLVFCRELGADIAINYHEPEFEQKLKNAAAEGIDLVFDTVGGSRYGSLHPRLLNKYGRWIIIGLLAGRNAEIDLGQILIKNIIISGSTLRSRPQVEKEGLIANIQKEVIQLYKIGVIRPVLDKVFPIEEAETAHEYMQSGKAQGKIVLAIS